MFTWNIYLFRASPANPRKQQKQNAHTSVDPAFLLYPSPHGSSYDQFL